MSDSNKITLEHEAPDRGFTHVRNELIEDRDLSWKALGLLLYLLRQPPWWQFSLCHISKQKTDRIDSTRAGIRELEKCGYLTRHPRTRLENGRYGNARWVVRTVRPSKSAPSNGSSDTTLGNPTRGKPMQGKPTLGKPTLTSTKPQQVLYSSNTTTAGFAGHLIPPAYLATEDGSHAVLFVSERLGRSDLAQKVLDELDGKIAQQRIKGDWQSYLHGLIKSALEGRFVPAAGRLVAKRRIANDAERKPPPVKKASPEVVKQHLNNIEGMLKGRLE